MKRIWIVLCLLGLLCSGCAPAPAPEASQPPAQSPGQEPAGVTFTDALDREVTVKRADRVAAMLGSFADIWLLAGGEDSLVAAANDAWTSFGLTLDIQNLGTTSEPNLELLASTQPDLILASVNTASNVELLDQFEQAGWTVAYFKVTNFQDYLHMLDICTQITGRADRYQTYGQALQNQVERAVGRADGSQPTVLYVRSTGSSCKVKNSKNSVLGEMLADLGCVNVADSQTSLLEQLSLEVILEQDPDFIFAVLQGADPTVAQERLEKTLLSNPAWQTLTAVREGRFHILDNQLYNLKPNERWGDAYEQLAEILYP